MGKRKLDERGGDAEWSYDDQLQLLEALKSQCPENDNKSYAARGKNLDWEKVAIDGHTPEQCQAAWTSMLTKVRKFRTLEEVLSDARDHVMHPEKYTKLKKKEKHPDQPTKPLTAYFQFMTEHRKRMRAKHPDLTITQLAKKLAMKWASLNPDKRKKYENRYHSAFDEYRKASEKFLESHPELVKLQKPKVPSPLSIFVNSKKQSLTEKHPQLSNKELYAKLRKKYAKLSPEKRKKWVQKAVDAVPDYEEEVRNYQLRHPDFRPPKKKVRLSAEEQELAGLTKQKKVSQFHDAPHQPPRSAFNLYVQKNLHKLEGKMKEKMQTLGQQWKDLGPKQAKYVKKLTKVQKRYKEQVEEYAQTLSAEKLALFQQSLSQKSRRLLGNLFKVNGDISSELQENTSNHALTTKIKESESEEQTYDNEGGNSSDDFE